MLPVRFRTFLRQQQFLRTQTPTLISRPSRECSYYNFRARGLPIFVSWPKYATRAILRDSEKATLLRAQSHTLITWISPECSFYNFCRRPLPIIIIWPKYTKRAISRDSETATFLARPITHANIPALPRALLL